VLGLMKVISQRSVTSDNTVETARGGYKIVRGSMTCGL
jgi:hypothetical protein